MLTIAAPSRSPYDLLIKMFTIHLRVGAFSKTVKESYMFLMCAIVKEQKTQGAQVRLRKHWILFTQIIYSPYKITQLTKIQQTLNYISNKPIFSRRD